MKELFKKSSWFLVPWFFFLIVGAIIIALEPHGDLHIKLNKFHNAFGNFLFYYITFLGDGITATIVVVMLLAVKYKDAILVGLCVLVSSAVTQLLKHTLFSDYVRPKKFFEGVYQLNFVQGIDNYSYYSFPSGHTTVAFSLYFSLAVLVKNNNLKFLFFIIALSAGFSRIYLSQHFFEDVYAGSCIGVSCSFFICYFLNKSKRISSSMWMEKSLTGK